MFPPSPRGAAAASYPSLRCGPRSDRDHPRLAATRLTRSIDEPDRCQVRARVRRDLENLQGFVCLNETILETPNADYRWRKGVFGGTDQANGREKRGSAKAAAAALEVGATPMPPRPTPAQPRFSLFP